MEKQKTRILSLLLSIILIAGITPKTQAMSLKDLTQGITRITEVTDVILGEVKQAIAIEFTDFKIKEWYADCVAKLVAVEGIKGYPDNTFRPNGTITKAEFVKILIASLYGDQVPTSTHWASGYIAKAESVGILSPGEISVVELDKAISRQEIAKIISLALDRLGERMDTDTDDIKAMITDKSSIGSGYADHVYNTYGKGIITGYPDGSFKPTNTATRAEASTMLVRLLDDRQRAAIGYNTVESLGYVSQPISNFGATFYNNVVSALYSMDQVVVIKKADLPLKLTSNIILHDIELSEDGKNILITQENKVNDIRTGVYLAVRNEGFRSRNAVTYYEENLGNYRYQTTHYIVRDIEPDYKTFSLDMVEYFVFSDPAHNRFIALEKEDVLGE